MTVITIGALVGGVPVLVGVAVPPLPLPLPLLLPLPESKLSLKLPTLPLLMVVSIGSRVLIGMSPIGVAVGGTLPSRGSMAGTVGTPVEALATITSVPAATRSEPGLSTCRRSAWTAIAEAARPLPPVVICSFNMT